MLKNKIKMLKNKIFSLKMSGEALYFKGNNIAVDTK